jgi:hypothetical protein
MRGRTPAVAIVLAVAVLAVWRGACILAGPDVDTDAYAHHMIARAILADPSDLAVHWVWLPLFHYLQVPLVVLGGTLNTVRWINLTLAVALPLVLFRFVRGTAQRGAGPMTPDATALVAALLAAGCPIAMQMGTTGQPEPLFALLALGVAIAFERRRHAAAAAMLGAAVILRYEAWAMLATAGALTAIEPWWPARRGPAPEPGPKAAAWRRWLVPAVPVALILVWAVLRRPVDGRWFGFLGDTHEFANQAIVDGAAGRTPVGLARDVLFYPLTVALHVLGPAVPLAAIGAWRTWRQQGARFVLVLASVLGFISLTWVKRSSLGLDRHFVAVVPLYATCAAQGVAFLAEAADKRLGAFASAKVAARAAGALAVALAVGTLATLGGMLVVWMGFWRGSIERGWPERAALGAYLRGLPATSTVFCDDATLEILSGLDRHRFDRHWIDDPHTWSLVEDAAASRGEVYVATWERKLREHEASGDVVFRARPEGTDDAAAGVAVMHVPPDANRAAR